MLGRIVKGELLRHDFLQLCFDAILSLERFVFPSFDTIMKGDCRIADIGCIKCPIVSFPFRELPFFIAERRSKRIDTFRFSPIKGIVGYLVFVFAGDKRILCIPVVKGQMALFRTADRGEIGRIGNRLGSIAVQPVSGKRLGIVDWSNKTCPFLLPSG